MAMRFTILSLAMLAAAAMAAPSLAASCPPAGDTQSPARQAANELRNRDAAPDPAEIDASASLPALVFPGDDLGRWNHRQAATVMGFVIDVIPGTLDSANCHADRDTLIVLGQHQDDPPNQRLVVAVTPHWRGAMQGQDVDWSTLGLQHSLIGHWVRVTGWLYDDWEAKNEAQNTAPDNSDATRATIWELHPVTQIQVLN
jgi:hypothetical protein